MADNGGSETTRPDESTACLHVTQPEDRISRLANARTMLRTVPGRVAVGCVQAGVCVTILWLGLQAAPFRVDPERNGLRIDGVEALGAEEVRQVFAADSGASLLAVDLESRREQLRAIPWIQSAVVSRVWPRTIAVTIVERDPVAFLRLPDSSAIRMIDSHGAIFDLRETGESSLPVLTGIHEGMPVADRRRRIRLFEEVMKVFGEAGLELASRVSEIDAGDPSNAVVLIKHRGRMVKIQMGDRHLRHRLDVYLNYIDAWKAEFGPVEAVDLRFEKQIAVQPATNEEEPG